MGEKASLLTVNAKGSLVAMLEENPHFAAVVVGSDKKRIGHVSSVDAKSRV